MVSEQQMSQGHPQKPDQEDHLLSIGCLGRGWPRELLVCTISLADSSFLQPGKHQVHSGTEQQAGVNRRLAPSTTAELTLPPMEGAETDIHQDQGTNCYNKGMCYLSRSKAFRNTKGL